MDRTVKKRIYTCATAHLDTVWNWNFEHSISVCLYNTLVKNFKLFQKYPDYRFNFEGSYRYELFEEYYPELFETLKKQIAAGRWNVTGSAFENGDVNVPSPEALFRNILYGNGYFRKAFGKTSKEIFLPDCFGFGYALPSVIHHANLYGFTTQKLSWGSAYGVPFDIGKWYGPDGKYCFACLKPGRYITAYSKIRGMKENIQKLQENAEKYGLPWTFSFHGTGDQGGAPRERSVRTLQNEIEKNESSDVEVISARSDEIYDDLNALLEQQKEKLPSWNNELVMTNHGVGGYTSRAIGKRWNRKCEELADMTERNAVFGSLLESMVYPQAQLEKAWKRVIAHQFHDDLPGTSLQQAYQRSWNDYVLSMNQLEKEITHSLGAVAENMDTSWVKGTAVVVNNTIEQPRRGLVQVIVTVSPEKAIHVSDAKGNSIPAQIIKRSGEKAVVAFIADVGSLGYKVFDLTESDHEATFEAGVTVTKTSLENSRFAVTLDSNGDIAGIKDKKFGKQLLSEPIRHQLIDYYGSFMWPAWELTYQSVYGGAISSPKLKEVRVLYAGAVTGAVEVTQTYGPSTFRSVISLDQDGECVNVENELDWQSLKTLLKDKFCFTVSNEKALFDLGLGAIKRPNETSDLYEVPAQKWADLSADRFGISVISDCKYGWDKPNNNTLRMTVLHTPRRNFLKRSMQSLMDIGLNRYSYAIHSHGDEIDSTQRCAREFNQPLIPVLTDRHTGSLGSEYSFGTLNKPNVILRALKKAEDSDKIIVRFNEGAGKATEGIRFLLGDGIESANEVYASEEYLGSAPIENGELVFDLSGYGIRSFALTLKRKAVGTPRPEKQLELNGNVRIFTKNSGVRPVLKNEKHFIPSELNPQTILYNGVTFCFEKENALSCSGQEITLDRSFNKLYLLTLSFGDDRDAVFNVGGKPVSKKVFRADERIGVWDLFGAGDKAEVKECDLAYEFTHAHTENGADIIAKQLYVFCCELDTDGESSIVLPDDRNLLILASTMVKKAHPVTLGMPLYDRVPQNRTWECKFTLKERWLQFTGKLSHNMGFAAPLVRRADGYRLK